MGMAIIFTAGLILLIAIPGFWFRMKRLNGHMAGGKALLVGALLWQNFPIALLVPLNYLLLDGIFLGNIGSDYWVPFFVIAIGFVLYSLSLYVGPLYPLMQDLRDADDQAARSKFSPSSRKET
jgi:hypothetical protein